VIGGQARWCQVFASVACWERLALKIGRAEDGEWCRYSRAARVGVVVEVGAIRRSLGVMDQVS
jgi:hypothetical protein